MAKSERPHITWKLTDDGIKPIETPSGFVACNPLVRSLPPEAHMTLKLQVSADCPMLAWPVASHMGDLTVAQIIMPGQEVTVELVNKSKHMAMTIESSEALVNLYPLLNPGCTSGVA